LIAAESVASEQQHNQDLRGMYNIQGDANSWIHHFLPECIAFIQSALHHFLPEFIAPRTIQGCHTVITWSIFAWIPVWSVSGFVLLWSTWCEENGAWLLQLMLLVLMQCVKVYKSGWLIVTIFNLICHIWSVVPPWLNFEMKRNRHC